jgi:hypothetical protein
MSCHETCPHSRRLRGWPSPSNQPHRKAFSPWFAIRHESSSSLTSLYSERQLDQVLSFMLSSSSHCSTLFVPLTGIGTSEASRSSLTIWASTTSSPRFFSFLRSPSSVVTTLFVLLASSRTTSFLKQAYHQQQHKQHQHQHQHDRSKAVSSRGDGGNDLVRWLTR